ADIFRACLKNLGKKASNQDDYLVTCVTSSSQRMTTRVESWPDVLASPFHSIETLCGIYHRNPSCLFVQKYFSLPSLLPPLFQLPALPTGCRTTQSRVEQKSMTGPT